MPYTIEELKKNEFWQRLHVQDRVDYQKKLEQAETFRDATQIAMGDEDGSTSRAIFGWRSQGADLTYSAWPLQFRWIDNPADVSAHTYSMKWYVNTANAWLGRTVDASDSLSYNRSPCSISASEILA